MKTKAEKKTKAAKTAEAPKKKAPKTTEEIQHVFYVTDVQFWKVIIIRYQLVKKTAKYVMVYDSTFKKIRLVPNDADGIVCDDYKTARVEARSRIKEKKALLAKYKVELDVSSEELKQRAIRDVVPRKFDLSKLNEKDYKF